MPETTQFAGMGGEDSTDSSLQANTVLQRRYNWSSVYLGMHPIRRLSPLHRLMLRPEARREKHPNYRQADLGT